MRFDESSATPPRRFFTKPDAPPLIRYLRKALALSGYAAPGLVLAAAYKYMPKWVKQEIHDPKPKNKKEKEIIRNGITDIVTDISALKYMPYMRSYSGYKRSYRGRGSTKAKRRRFRRRYYKRKLAIRKKYDPAIRALSNMLNKRVGSLSRQVNQSLATHTGFLKSTFRLASSVKRTTNQTYTPWGFTNMVASLGNLRFYNPATNALVTNNADSGTYNREFLFKNVYSSITLRANYHMPVEGYIYVVVPKDDTDNSPSAAVTAGATDQALGPLTSKETQLDLFPTHMDHFNRFWKIVKRAKVNIKAGGTMTVAYSPNRSFIYDPANADAHALEYQSKYHAHAYYVRIRGPIAHDSANFATEIGVPPVSVDVELNTKYVIRYEAGKNLDDKYYSDGSTAAFTNQPFVTQLDTEQAVNAP